MGIVHFAPVGTSPGAVTSALDYLKQHEAEVKRDYGGGICEDVVLFCSWEVERGECPSSDFVWNDYGRLHAKKGWQRPAAPPNVIAVIWDFLVAEGLLQDKGRLYAWPVDVNKYQSCFEAVAKATLAMARGADTGKWIWANLTGGTNVLNAALMQVASLSGLIGRVYYTFVAHGGDRFLRPFSNDPAQYDFCWIPLIKTTFDLGYYRLLELLEDGRWSSGKELLDRLKGDDDPAVQGMFAGMDLGHFKNAYLNRMAGDVLEEQRGETGEGDRPVRIGQRGREVLEYIHRDKLVKALVRREQHNMDLIQQCREDLERHRRSRD